MNSSISLSIRIKERLYLSSERDAGNFKFSLTNRVFSEGPSTSGMMSLTIKSLLVNLRSV